MRKQITTTIDSELKVSYDRFKQLNRDAPDYCDLLDEAVRLRLGNQGESQRIATKLESLKYRRAMLQEELKNVNAKIEELEKEYSVVIDREFENVQKEVNGHEKQA